MLQTEGIILRTVKYSESSLILEIYTKAVGLTSFIISGVFKKGSYRLASTLQIPNQISIVAYYAEAKNLHRIKEVNINTIYQRINQQIKHSAVSTLLTEVCRMTLRDKIANPELYHFISNSYNALDQQDKLDNVFHLDFLLQLSHHLGFYPSIDQNSGADSFDLQNGVFVPFDAKNTYHVLPEFSAIIINLCQKKSLQLDIHQRRKLLEILFQYYQIHIANFKIPQSPNIFRTIF